MDNGTVKFEVTRLDKGERNRAELSFAREAPVTIILNDKELVTLLCTPIDLKHLAAGYLSSEGFIDNRDEIESIIVNSKTGIVRVQTTGSEPAVEFDQYKRMITSGCGRGVSFYSEADIATQRIVSQVQFNSTSISERVKEFQAGSKIYKETHGVHSAAICDEKRIIVFYEDIGRHNAVDKVFGKCMMEGIPADELMVVTSGRISSEIVHKVAKRRVPVLISISAPTGLGATTTEKPFILFS
jgi:FdhD protein